MSNMPHAIVSDRARPLSLVPAGAFFVALTLLPLANLVWLSFFKVDWINGQQARAFVGLANYAQLFGDSLFLAGILNTVIFVFVSTAAQVAIGLVLALLCSRVGKHSRLYRALLILTILIPGIIIGAIWRLMYNVQFGIINQALGALGIEPVDWLGSPSLALISVILVDIWHWTPFSFLLLLVAVENLPVDVSEAARIDGATAWQEFWRITLPTLLPTIAVTFAFRAIIALKVFDEIYLLTGGGPGTATEVVSFKIYQTLLPQDNIGYGSAMSVAVIFVVAVVIAAVLSRRQGEAA